MVSFGTEIWAASLVGKSPTKFPSKQTLRNEFPLFVASFDTRNVKIIWSLKSSTDISELIL